MLVYDLNQFFGSDYYEGKFSICLSTASASAAFWSLADLFVWDNW